MDQQELHDKMLESAEVAIRCSRSENAVAFPNANARSQFEAISKMNRRRGAFFATSIMLLLVYIAGEDGPLDKVSWFIPLIGLLGLLSLGISIALGFVRPRIPSTIKRII